MNNIKQIRLPEQIQYIRATRKVCTHCIDSNGYSHLLPATISEICRLLPPGNQHIRVHRSWIINKAYVVSVLPGNAFHMALLQMKDGTVIPVQKSSIKDIADLVLR